MLLPRILSRRPIVFVRLGCNMPQHRQDKAARTNKNRTEQHQQIILEGLDFLDSAVTQAEIGLLELYFGDLLKDLLTKGPAQ